MDRDTLGQRLRKNAAGIASILVTGIWLAALLSGRSWWLVALIVGYVVVVPIVAMLFEDEDEDEREQWWEGNWLDSEWWDDRWNVVRRFETGEEESAPRATNQETPLETLRRRYAAGELTDEQFERKLERLLETETLESVEDEATRRGERERTA
jgi:uncharacterized membrane protein